MSIIDAVNRWYAAWNAHDTAAIADAMSPDGTYLDPVLGSPIDRAATAEHAVSNLLTMFPDAHFEVLTVGAMSDISAAAQWRMTGTSTSKGRPVASNGAEFFTYDPLSDRLSSVVGYFDVLSVRDQLKGRD
jgi:ketosteroid isomerase-like protein